MDRPFHCFAQTARMRRAMMVAIAAVVLVLAGCPNPAGSDESDGSGGDNGTDGSGNGQAIAVTGVSLDQSSLSLTVGESVTLTATVKPSDAVDPSVSWSSDNTAVATVSDAGEVTAVGGGFAVVTVTTADGSFTATADVTVSPQTGDGSINVDFQNPDDPTVSISGVPASVSQGETFTVSASGHDSYTWYLNGDSGHAALSASSGASIDIDTSTLSLGSHQVSLFVTAGSDSYSTQVSFTVTEAVTTLIEAPVVENGGWTFGRAFYVTEYPGISLDTVSVWITSNGPGDVTVSLTARSDAYDGPVIATTQQSGTLAGTISESTQYTFDFGGVAVTRDSTVTFELEWVSGSAGTLYFRSENSDPSPLVVLTSGTSPPLDSPIGSSGVALIITGRP
mgnify:CR=1 FL=1